MPLPAPPKKVPEDMPILIKDAMRAGLDKVVHVEKTTAVRHFVYPKMDQLLEEYLGVVVVGTDGVGYVQYYFVDMDEIPDPKFLGSFELIEETNVGI